jgi:hypothetical protein
VRDERSGVTAARKFVFKLLAFDLHGVDFNFFERSIICVAGCFRDFLNDIHSADHFSEYGVAAVFGFVSGMIEIQEICWHDSDEKLAAVRVRPGVGHRQNSGARVL